MSKEKLKYEVREIDAWPDAESGWTWNDSCYLFNYEMYKGSNEKRSFLNALHRHGYSMIKGKGKVEDTGDILELQNRKTSEPLIAAIPQF